MTKLKNNKMLITSKVDLRAIKKLVTEKAFHEKFVVAMNVVSEVLAEEAMMNLYFEDSRMLTTEEMIDFKNSSLN